MPAAKPPFPSLQRGHPLAQGLVGDWPFYEGSGLTVNDVSGQGNNGVLDSTVATNPSWGGGPSGWCLTFNGSNNYVRLGSSAGNVAAPGLTAACWFRTTSAGYAPAAAGVFTKSHQASEVGRWGILFDNSDGKLYGLWTDTGAGGGVETAGLAGANDANWHQAVLTLDVAAGKVTLYLDGGASSASATGAGGVGVTADTLYLGAYGNTTNNAAALFFAGSIDGAVVYNRVLSANEIAALYADPFARHRRRSWRLKATTTVPSQVLVDLEHSPGFQPIVAM